MMEYLLWNSVVDYQKYTWIITNKNNYTEEQLLADLTDANYFIDVRLASLRYQRLHGYYAVTWYFRIRDSKAWQALLKNTKTLFDKDNFQPSNAKEFIEAYDLDPYHVQENCFLSHRSLAPFLRYGSYNRYIRRRKMLLSALTLNIFDYIKHKNIL